MNSRIAAIFVAVLVAGCTTEVSSVEIGSGTTTTSTTLLTDHAPPTSVAAPPAASSEVTTTTSTTTTSTTTTTLPPAPTTTSCAQIVHIGDSTSVSLWTAEGVGGADLTMEARYLAIGVEVVYPDNDDGRSIDELRYPTQVNAYDVAAAVKSNGYEGCWVLMIGTNDAANVAAGAAVGSDERINKMLELLGDDQILWVDSASLLTDDPNYGNQAMKAWNEALYRLTADRPNVAVLHWSDLAKAGWFDRDGIHYNTIGHAQRAAITAAAMVEYFPG